MAMRHLIGYPSMQRVYVQCDNTTVGVVSLDDTTGPTLATDHRGPRSVGVPRHAPSPPTGADGRSHRTDGATSRKRNERVIKASGSSQLHRHDQHRRDVRQHARWPHRAPGPSGITPHRQTPEDMKTPGAPTPDVLEFRWDRCLPDSDQTVAKR